MSQRTVDRRGADLFADEGRDGFLMRAFMRGAGFSSEHVRRRPVIGICTSWSELNPCNADLRRLSEAVKRGVLAAGGLPLEFPTISLAEPFVRPTTLYLRNLMAMDVEEMISASPIDAVVLLGGCDKTVPAQLMGSISAGKPAIMLTAGPRPTARRQGRPLTIDDIWPLADQRRQGRLDDDEWADLEARLNCGVGTCNVLGTAITMAMVAETLGMALPGSSLPPSGGAQRAALAEATGARAVELAGEGVVPADHVTPETLENAFRLVCAVSGSTNAVIHLEALAGRVGRRLGVEAMREWSATTPVLADVRPAGRHLLEDLQDAGGVPAVLAELAPLVYLGARSGTGRPWAEVTRTVSRSPGPALRTLDDPVFPAGGLALLRGSLAPRGAVLKRSAAHPALWRHRGRAVVFDGLADLNARIDDPALDVDRDSVLVLRGVGPVGGPGMPEVGELPIPRKLLDQGVHDMVRISDARMSGTGGGTVVLHVAPEAAAGGPLGLVRDGDLIELDAEQGRLDLLVDAAELAARAPATPPEHPARGYAALFRRHVLQSDEGCDFDFLRAAAESGTR
ncbi:dihydroxy-acid dehydratase [Nonomuraea lactucae]|uniref:dihydroxy-acid dehydratase n=1 Tax=Nonomuraea lactucae TaxID=2249762 RepID=UPI000DE400BB|nr:dihydroxy-acid dehydratase [Nonomuraea lactucae]